MRISPRCSTFRFVDGVSGAALRVSDRETRDMATRMETILASLSFKYTENAAEKPLLLLFLGLFAIFGGHRRIVSVYDSRLARGGWRLAERPSDRAWLRRGRLRFPTGDVRHA